MSLLWKKNCPVSRRDMVDLFYCLASGVTDKALRGEPV